MNVTGKNLKTMAVNLQVDLVDDVLQFHNKGNLCIDEKFKNRLLPHTLALDQLQSLERSDFEISPFHDEAVRCDSNSENTIRRQRSAKIFGETTIEFSTIKQLLHHSFGMRADCSRPYPSGGALYPVEVICLVFAEKIKNSPPAGFYHYRPTRHVLQPLNQMDSETMRKVVYHLEMQKVAAPLFAFLYVGVIPKMLVKYRYRGYRYALMEAGSMYQQADLIAQTLGLRNKLYSGFNDHELIKFIGLDNLNFIPLVVQSFGADICK